MFEFFSDSDFRIEKCKHRDCGADEKDRDHGADVDCGVDRPEAGEAGLRITPSVNGPGLCQQREVAQAVTREHAAVPPRSHHLAELWPPGSQSVIGPAVPPGREDVDCVSGCLVWVIYQRQTPGLLKCLAQCLEDTFELERYRLLSGL